MRQKTKLHILIAVVLLIFSSSKTVFAQTPTSTNYSVQESGFSSGSSINSSSSSYSARLSAGDLAVGEAESTQFRTYAGPISPDEEYVELVIPLSVIDMGVISPGTPGTGTATFSVRAYLNDNYAIFSPADPPTNGSGDMIDPMTSAGVSDTSAEQFGMNLVANTLPVAQGADPAPQPNAAFAYGEAVNGYDTANNYKYNANDTIAASDTRGYGETIFTISYIMNVTATTPAGLYRMEQDLVVTATF